jgi:hypothetical protein
MLGENVHEVLEAAGGKLPGTLIWSATRAA